MGTAAATCANPSSGLVYLPLLLLAFRLLLPVKPYWAVSEYNLGKPGPVMVQRLVVVGDKILLAASNSVNDIQRNKRMSFVRSRRPCYSAELMKHCLSASVAV